MMTAKTCDEIIDSMFASRMEDILPDFDKMDLKQLKEYCEDFTAEIPQGIIYHDGIAYAETQSDEINDSNKLDKSDELQMWRDFAECGQVEHNEFFILESKNFKAKRIFYNDHIEEIYYHPTQKHMYGNIEVISGLKINGLDISSPNTEYINRDQLTDFRTNKNEIGARSIVYLNVIRIMVSTGSLEDFFDIFWQDDGVVDGRYHYRTSDDSANRFLPVQIADDIGEALGFCLTSF